MIRANLIPAFVIHRRDYRNSSLLLELFTESEGRVAAIAKGVKSARSSRAMVLHPFTPLRVSLSGRGEVLTLSQAEADGRAYGLSGERVYCGLYLNELVLRLLHRSDPAPGLYRAYSEGLMRLAGEESMDRCLREFELQMLMELGYGLLLDRTADTDQPVEADRRYEYHVEQGPVIALSSNPENTVKGSTLLNLHHRVVLDATENREAKHLMRRVLAHYLGNRPLKSRELFQALKPNVESHPDTRL
ncbi:MAG: DNA repair protein RecO [Candidatus Thiodiazotropha sp.]